VPGSDLRFPYNQLWLLALWSGLFKPKQRFQPVSDRSPEWNRGAYLSEALAHYVPGPRWSRSRDRCLYLTH